MGEQGPKASWAAERGQGLVKEFALELGLAGSLKGSEQRNKTVKEGHDEGVVLKSMFPPFVAGRLCAYASE